MDFVFEMARDKDQNEILSLYESVFQKEVTKNWWKWRFVDNPIDESYVALARHGSAIASHYAISPVMLSVGSEKKLFALSMSTMTHKNYQGLGLFPQTAEFLYEKLCQSGYAGVIGFPNRNSHRTFIEKLGWSDILIQPTISVSLNQIARPEGGRDMSVEAVTEDLAKNLASVTETYNQHISLSPDAEYLCWRFSEQSGNEYFAVSDDRNKLGRALIIFKFYEQNCVDIVFSNNISTEFLSGALLCIADHFNLKDLTAMTWQNVHSNSFLVWEKLGGIIGEPLTYFAGREFTAGTGLFDARNWKMDMALSDVY